MTASDYKKNLPKVDHDLIPTQSESELDKVYLDIPRLNIVGTGIIKM